MRGALNVRGIALSVITAFAVFWSVTGSSSRAPAVPRATPVTVVALPPTVIGKIGALVPFDEYEAENAVTSGVRIGPDRRFTTIAAEASGRHAVRLERPGDHVTFVLRRAADAVTVRGALPDGADGRGIDAALSVFANGAAVGKLELTSRYSWFYGRYPFTNDPADGMAHHFFDETRFRFPRRLPPGTVVRFEIPQGDRAPWYVVDLADFERVPPPLKRPRGSLDVRRFGADATGRALSTAAFERGIAASRRAGVPLWIPPGTFRINRHLIVDRVAILGAGPWHSIVRGDGVGFYGRPAPDGSSRVELGQFTIEGEVTDRIDYAQRNAIGGAMGDGSYIHDLFLQHHKVGLWFDGPMRGIRIERLRVTDCTADGLNLHRGVSDARVEDSFWRNTGDDGIAAWSHQEADHGILIRGNTIIAPILANGIAIYGGRDIVVRDNLMADTLTEGGGLHVGNRFGAVPVAGRMLFADNVIVRGGGSDPRWASGIAAVWFYALDAPIHADISLRRLRLVDSTNGAVQFVGKPISGVTLDDVETIGKASIGLPMRNSSP